MAVSSKSLVFLMTLFSVYVLSLALEDHVAAEIKEMRAEMQRMQSQIDNMEGVNKWQNDIIYEHLKVKSTERQRLTIEARNAFNSLGCLGDILTLSCPDDRLIQVTRAVYGKYEYPCTDTCCAPNPQHDCTEDVATNFPEDWAYLQFLCANQISCDYEYKGISIPECEQDYLADYMQIFFDCTPEPAEPVVGFTASASATRSYAAGEIVLFDSVQSNFGGHYNPVTSTFLCPYHATYLFSVNYLGDLATHMEAQIMLDSSLLARPHADSGSATHHHASALVITECTPGQTIWVSSGTAGGMYGISKFSLWSGYLMQHFN